MNRQSKDQAIQYYRDLARDHAIPAHMIQGVVDYVVSGVRPGRFLQAVFANNLWDAACRADIHNAKLLREWSIFVWNFLPSDSVGSIDRVNAWIEKGGSYPAQNKEREDG